jgi:hypothetical protein
MSTNDRQKQLKKFLDRRHPLYEAMRAHWEFLATTYEGGREWFESNIFRYIKEGDGEFKDRVQRAYRFNHTREVVDLVNKYLFKMECHRNTAEAPPAIKEFWEKATLQGQGIKDYMRSVSAQKSIYGRVWLVVDSNKGDDVLTKADEKAAGVRVYSYMVEPQHVLDMSYDELGELNWVLIHELRRDDEDPIASSGKLKDQFRLWTKQDSQLFRVERQGNKVVIVEDPKVNHGLGVVPVFPADNVLTDEKWCSPSMIADVAYLDRAVANYLSNLDAIIQDQTFSQLAMPAQGVTADKTLYQQLLELGTKRIFIYDGGEGGNQPFYLSPDVKQAELILKVINKIINEIYHSVGLAGERTKEDNALGIDNSSGVAKAYDFERVNSLLASKADSLEAVENKLVHLVGLYTNTAKQIKQLPKPLVEYPDNFDVRGLYDEFEIAARLALIEAPDEVRRKQMESVVDKLFPQLAQDLREKMLDELKSWPPKIDLLAPGAGGQSNAQAIRATGKQALSSKLVSGAKKGAAI